MNTNLINSQQKIAKGSILDVANQTGKSFAESFLECDAIIAVDVSASMSTRDCQENTSRFDMAVRELEKLQAQLPGKVAVCSFSSSTKFIASGVLKDTESLTDMVKCLEFLKDFDGAGIKIILISDGEPDEKEPTLKLAQTFVTKIDTVFVGNETSKGREFLRQLAEATGGISITNKTQELNLLSSNLRLLLGA